MNEQVFRLPDLGEGLTEAEIIEWQVAVGDTVTIDQEVVVVETAKATVEVPCPYAGRVVTLHAAEGEVLEVGKPMISVALEDAGPHHGGTSRSRGDHEEEQAGSGSGAVLIGYGTGAPRPRRRRVRQARPDAPVAPPGPPAPPALVTSPAPAPSPADHGAIRVISPLVRRLARDNDVELATLPAAVQGDVVRRSDVEAALRAPAGSTGEIRIPLRGIRKVMADKLSTSRREIPDATTWVDVDATGLMEAKDALKATLPDAGIGILALIARITVTGLRRFPELNSSVDLERAEIVQHAQVNLGFAAQSPRGLVVPVIHDAHRLSTTELAASLRELTSLAREGRLTPAQLTGGTFTLNNYGVFGVDGSTPIINHPEAAMLGVGRIIDKPWAHQGEIALRKVTQLSFSFDHRVCDGGTAGGFLRYVADCVETPTTLLAEL